MIERFGVPPDKVVDVQALIGDIVRQRAGRAGHRREDRGAADQRVRRSRDAARARRRDQAAQAPREPDRVRRPGAAVASTLVHPRLRTCRSMSRSPRPRVRAARYRRRCSASCASSNSPRWSAASPMGSAPSCPKGMTPSPTPQRARRDDYDHPLRRSPRGRGGVARREPQDRGRLAGAACGGARGQARSDRRSTAPTTRR